jgi:NodT family efflux transporter outer membrane factor (OMF) lipoprotein
MKFFIPVHPRSSASICVLLAACTVGPNYQRPEVETPPAYKEAAGDWVVAQPKDDVPRGRWWEIFGDPVLGTLMDEVSVSNQTLRAAEARYTRARASTRGARSALFPSVGVSADAGRARRSGGATASAYSVGLDASWQADLWGRVRRQIEASRAAEEASAADVEAARLSLQAELATNYIQLRVTDAQAQLLEGSLKAFQTSFDIAQNRYRAGVAAKADVIQAEAQLKSIQAQVVDLRATRAQLEHAIAVLVGKAPASFDLQEHQAQLDIKLPDVPPGVPSTLLERRPDIAAAERRMAAANANIGVAQAAYYPSLSLTASGGFAGASLGNLISAPNRVWSLGLGVAETILDFGARSAQVDVSRAAYDEAVANYRATVLDAFRDVENALSNVHYLQQELVVQQEAVQLARQSVQIARNQYKAGTIAFLNVVQLQTTQLAEERTYVNLVGRRAAASVALVLALGGEW